MSGIGKMAANAGTYVLNDTSEAIMKIKAIYIAEDTIFTKITINGVDVKSQYIADNSIPIRAGVMITPKGGYLFASVQLTYGQVTLIR
jgi:hypothetical protein